MERLNEYVLSPEALSMVSGSSKGTQTKYYDKGYWYKKDAAGYEGRAEYLASLVLSCSNVEEYVTYEQCTINGKSGCRSFNFLKEEEAFISLQRLYDIYVGGQINDRIYLMDNVEERIQYVVDFVKEYTNLDLYEYLRKMMSFDALVLNTDRHFHNIGLVCNADLGTYRPAPLFDHGSSLLSSFVEFPPDMPMQEALDRVVGKPFSANLEYQAHCFSYGLVVDYDQLRKKLKNEEDSRALEVLKRQLCRYEDRFRAVV